MLEENRKINTGDLEKLIRQLKFEEYKSMMSVIPVTISMYTVELKPSASIEAILTKLKEIIEMHSSDMAGFTKPITEKGMLKTTYYKRSPLKIGLPDERSLVSYKIWPVLSENKIDIIIRSVEKTDEGKDETEQKKRLEIYLVGGNEDFVRRLWKELLFKLLNDAAKTQRISTTQNKFTYELMRQMLEKLEGTKYIKLDPTQNQKFAKILQDVEDGRKKSIQYFIEEIDIRGYKVLDSPGILSILKEKNIRIIEILGKIKYTKSYLITVWIRKDGKVTVYIPASLLENAEGSEDIRRMEAIEKAIEIYKKLIMSIWNNEPKGKIGKQVTLFTFQK